ncbi:MAG: hypothetical protein ACPGC0_05900, partial [Opitutales bacterium]
SQAVQSQRLQFLHSQELQVQVLSAAAKATGDNARSANAHAVYKDFIVLNCLKFKWFCTVQACAQLSDPVTLGWRRRWRISATE